MVNLGRTVCPKRNHSLYYIPTATSTKTDGGNFPKGLAQKKNLFQRMYRCKLLMENENTSKFRLLLRSSSRILGIHKEGSFFTPLTLSSPLLRVRTEASHFLILDFHHQSAHRKIFHHHKSTWPLLMLGPKLDKHYKILKEGVKWIILDIFHESYILLTFLSCVFLF